MSLHVNHRLISSCKSFANYGSFVIIIVGLFVIYGWAFDIPLLKSVLPGFATMKANTALCFILAGVGLWVVNDEAANHEKIWVARSCGALVSLIALLSLGEYIFRQDLGIDQLIFRDLETPAAAYPGRMSITTAVNFVFLGVALFVLSLGVQHEERISQSLAIIAGSITFLTLIGYLYQVESLYRVGPYSSMAFHSAVGFSLLTVGIFFARPQKGLMRLITTDANEGHVARRLLPVALGMPVILGWFRLWGERLGFYDSTFGLALMVILTTGLLSLVIWWNAGWLRRSDIERRQAEEKLRYQAHLLSQISDAVIATDEQLRITAWNRAAEKMYGWSEAEVLGRNAPEILRSELTSEQRTEAMRQIKDSITARSERLQHRRGGEPVYVEANTIVLTDEQGQTTGFVSVNRDITERKRAEEALRESERQMTALITSLDDVIFEFDEHGTYLNVWTADESMLAQPKAQLLGRHINDVLGEENGRLFTEAVKRVVISGRSEMIEYPLQVLGGQRWFIARISPITAQDTPHRTASMLIRDITQRKHVEEQNRFQANLVASVADAIVATDMQLNIQSWNTGAEMIYGWKAEEVLGRPAKEILDTDFGENTREVVTKQILEQGYWQGEVSQLRRDGTRIPTLSSVSLYKDSEGKPAGVVAVNRDITERKQAEAAVSASQKRLQSLIEHAPDGIALLGLNGKLQQVTPSVQKILGYILEEAVEQDPASLTHPDDLPSLLGLLSDLIQNPGKVITTEYRFKHKDGSWRWLESTISNLIAEPSVEAIVFNYRDITGYKEAQQEILRLNEELEQRVIERTQQLEVANRELETVNKELEAFSYSVSHDLRAPLRSIDGFSQALLEDYGELVPKEGRKFLEHVRTSAHRMAQLIDGLLDLSRVTRADIKAVPVDLTRLTENILTELQRSHPQRSVKCSITPNLTVRGDPRLLQVVLENLLNNAWKYTSKREETKIEFGSRYENGETIYFVCDNGAGFDMTYADKLFGVFQRLHTTTEFPGTGVGLATVQRIIHRHGGRIWAESELDKGTTFYFTIPDANSQ